MKRVLSLLILLPIFLCACKQSEMLLPTLSKNESYELQLSSYFEIDGANWYSESDLIGSATPCKENELLNTTEIDCPGEYEEPRLFVVSGKLFSIDVFPENRTRIASLESTNSGNSYEVKEIQWAEQIVYLFEKDGYLIYCAGDGNKHKLMKYDIENKTAYMLNEAFAEKHPDYYDCGSYIAILPSAEYTKENGLSPRLQVSFCDFQSGQMLADTLSVNISSERPIITKNIKNNYFITYSLETKQLLFYDILKGKIISQALYVPSLLRTKIIGNYLINCDADGVKLYDFETESYYLIYCHNWEQEGVESCNAKLIGDNIFIHIGGQKPMIYNLKTKKYAVINSADTATGFEKYTDDGENIIVFVLPCKASDESNKHSYYMIKKYEIRD